VPESITIFALSFHAKRFTQQFRDDVRKLIAKNTINRVCVFTEKYSNWSNTYVQERTLDSIVLRGNQRDEIVTDITRFFANESWYLQRGVPYRRGYLFYGPPGTGK